MKVASIRADDRGVVCESCAVANNPLTRMRGLLGRRSLAPGEGMLFPGTGAVHTMFMRFPIDVVFLDAGLEVMSVRASVPMWRAVKQRGAHSTLELAAGEAARVGIEPGVSLTLDSG